jgi:hypothetical protein
MQYSYRGISYQSEAAMPQANDVDIVGKYRGISTHLGLTDKAPERFVTLRYRGTSYIQFS